MVNVHRYLIITYLMVLCHLGGKQEHWFHESGFQKWDKSKILLSVLAFMKSVFDLCFINDHPYLLNRIQSPAEHLLIIFY
jgi:hypothetical protein